MRYLNCVFVAVSLLLSGMALTSCGNDAPAAVQEVYVPAGMSTDVEIKPWGSVVANAIVFNSTGEWASEIYATGSSFAIPDAPSGDDVDWLEVLPFKGGPGEVKASLYATPNNATDSRYAVVRIVSPTNSIVFRVTQHGRSAGDGGDSPAPNPGGE